MLLARHHMVRPDFKLCRLAVAALLVGLAALAPREAAAEDAAARFAEAQRYENAEGVTRDYVKALELYCAASQAGHADAAYAIGWMFLNGRGVKHDDATGAAWMRIAAERGHGH